MGTNYYAIPTEAEMLLRKKRLEKRIKNLDMAPANIEREFQIPDESSYDYHTPWSEFLENMKIHLGKRSSGWKFCWNFHDKKYYTNKDELIAFINKSRIIDEYGKELPNEEFLTMALNWGEPGGLIVDATYEERRREDDPQCHIWGPKYYDSIIDGLRVSSSTQFS
jgi:hypothetical protein